MLNDGLRGCLLFQLPNILSDGLSGDRRDLIPTLFVE